MGLLLTSSDKVWKDLDAKERLIGAISGSGRRWSFATRQKL